MTQHVGIIGGGIIGLCCAYYLQKNGNQVTIFDRGEVGLGASHASSGIIATSNYRPLTHIGIFNNGFRGLFNRENYLYVKPRFDLKLFKWLHQLNRHRNVQHGEKAKALLYEMQLYSLMLYQLMELDLETTCDQSGGYYIANTDKGLDTLKKIAEESQQLMQIPIEMLSAEQIQARENGLSLNCKGGLYYPNETKLEPHTFMHHLHDYLLVNGATIHSQCHIERVEKEGGQVQALVDKHGKTYHCDQFVFSVGVANNDFAKELGVNVPMQPIQSYSFDTPKSESGVDFKTPLLLLEEKIIVTPFSDKIRVSGKLVISGRDASIQESGINSMRTTTNQLFNDFSFTEGNTQNVWSGSRACAPDGLPYIGRVNEKSNVVVATGLGMQGLSLAAAVGQIVSNIVADKGDNSIEKAIDSLRVGRFN